MSVESVVLKIQVPSQEDLRQLHPVRDTGEGEKYPGDPAGKFLHRLDTNLGLNGMAKLGGVELQFERDLKIDPNWVNCVLVDTWEKGLDPHKGRGNILTGFIDADAQATGMMHLLRTIKWENLDDFSLSATFIPAVETHN